MSPVILQFGDTDRRESVEDKYPTVLVPDPHAGVDRYHAQNLPSVCLQTLSPFSAAGPNAQNYGSSPQGTFWC